MKERLIKTAVFSAGLCFTLAGIKNGWNIFIMFIVLFVTLLVAEWYVEK